VAVTLRESHGATRNGWSGLLVERAGHAFARRYEIDVVDGSARGTPLRRG
jgi:hypothetical protein